MKGLFLNLPMTGHINPTLDLVQALVKSGDEIHYWCGKDFQNSIEASGAAFFSYSIEIEAIDPRKKMSGVEYLTYLSDISLRLLQKHIKEWSEAGYDYVITDSCLVVGKIIAEYLGIPGVTSTTTFSFSEKMLRTPSAISSAILSLFVQHRKWADWRRLRKKISSDYQVKLEMLDVFTSPQDLNLTYTSSYFQPMLKTLDLKKNKFIGPLLKRQEAKESMDLDVLAKKTVIYISLGTVYNLKPEFFLNCIKAYEARKNTVLLLSIGQHIPRSSLPEDSESLRIYRVIPQLAVLPFVDLFICHGGMNSVNEAMYHKVPVMIFPQQDEQMLVAKRVAALGAGINMGRPIAEPTDIRRSGDRILSSTKYQENAAKIAESFNGAEGAAGGVNLIHQYVKSNAFSCH